MGEVLALKYRPKEFSEVIGQDLVIKKLQSAIENNTLGHALLFCGTRGTGKTTVARIIAQELNKNTDLPTQRNLNIAEIDAASHTGVDNVREIIENIRYNAFGGQKIVILDEAHMLSKSAFNALLKTLEEPPQGVTFILVTTEPHKLPATVVSRCQKYEFQEVDLETLEDYYIQILKLEGVEADVKALALKANGSVRDGLSILQTVLSGEQEVDNSKQYFELVGALYSHDVTTALQLISEIRKTEEARVIVQTLERWFYECSMESFGRRTSIREFFENKTLKFDLPRLQYLFNECLEAERSLTLTPNSKIVLDMAIIKMTL